MIRLKYEFTNVKLKFIFICYIIFIILIYIYSTLIKKQNDNKSQFNTLYYSKDYIRNKFIIIQNTCNTCGLFSFYKLSIGCIFQNNSNIKRIKGTEIDLIVFQNNIL